MCANVIIIFQTAKFIFAKLSLEMKLGILVLCDCKFTNANNMRL